MALTKKDLADIRNVVLDALEVAVEPRLERLEVLADKMERRMDGMEGRMDGMEGRMGNMEGKMGEQESGQRETNRRLASIESKLEDADGLLIALQNDVKELYDMVAKLQHSIITDKAFAKLPTNKKLLTLHGEVQLLAKHLKIQLPQS